VAKVSLVQVMNKLDRLDGTPDAKFVDEKYIFRLPAMKECAKLKAEGSINCQQVIANLDKLVGVANMLPLFKLVASSGPRGSISAEMLTEAFQAEDIFVAVSIITLVDLNMRASVLEDASVDITLQNISFDKLSGSFHDFGATVLVQGFEVNIDYSSVIAQNVADAYRIFERVGQRHGFNPDFLRPSNVKPTPSGELPATPMPTTTAAAPTQQSPVQGGGLDFSAYQEDPAASQQQPTPSPQASSKEKVGAQLNFDAYREKDDN